jgi:hypothetical protein
MGDHRANSADSRFHQADSHHGTIAERDVTGVVEFHGSRLGAYAWVLGRAALIAVGIGLLVTFTVAMIRRRRDASGRQVPA